MKKFLLNENTEYGNFIIFIMNLIISHFVEFVATSLLCRGTQGMIYTVSLQKLWICLTIVCDIILIDFCLFLINFFHFPSIQILVVFY